MTKSTAIRVGVHEAKTRFSELLRAVAAGQSVEILRNGEPVARLVPMTLPATRTFGADRGRFVVPDDFDAALPAELLEAFEG
ncbi:MAG: type II toxin-antitoxin system Phd/YefM family antitoxin [Acidimicrobiales bacterium]